MDRTELLFTTDKKKLHKFFLKDPVLYAYHIGDLDDFYFENCQWAVTYGEGPFIKECVLVYHGLSTPSVIAFGRSEMFGPLLERMLDIFPSRFFCHFQEPSDQILKSRFKMQPLGTHLKMRLDLPERLSQFSTADQSIVRLDASHVPDLLELFESSYPGNYFEPQMLESRKYLGLYENGRLVGVAGVHAHSDQYKIGVLGNITTDQEFRGQGLATRLTGALCHELHGEGCLISLNVAADNPGAIKCYERLGFVVVHEYQEGLFELK